MAVAVIVVPVLSAAERVIASLTDFRAKKKNCSTITAEIDKFIGSLNENVDLLKEHLPEQRGSWAIESLETDLNAVASFLEEGLKKGKFKGFWDADRIKDVQLERLRHDLINQLQVKLFIATLKVAIDAHWKMEDFETKLLELSSRQSAAQSHQVMADIRKLLQPLVEGTRRQDQRIQSFVSTVRENKLKVETSAKTQKFLADVLANLEELTEEGSPARSTPREDDLEYYLDPISRKLMCDPVKCTDGETYDRFSVFRYNLNQKSPLVIACDDLKVRRKLFQTFPEQGAERKFHNLRRWYRDNALASAKLNSQSAEALAMINNVLQWAPNDTECLETGNLLKLEIAEQQGGMVANEEPQRRQAVAANKASPPSTSPIKYMLPSPKPPVIEITELRVEHEFTKIEQEVAADSTSPEVLSDRIHRYFTSMLTLAPAWASPEESYAPPVQCMVKGEPVTMQQYVSKPQENQTAHESQMNQDSKQQGEEPSKWQNKEGATFGIIIMVLCFTCSLCCIPCPDACCTKKI